MPLDCLCRASRQRLSSGHACKCCCSMHASVGLLLVAFGKILQWECWPLGLLLLCWACRFETGRPFMQHGSLHGQVTVIKTSKMPHQISCCRAWRAHLAVMVFACAPNGADFCCIQRAYSSPEKAARKPEQCTIVPWLSSRAQKANVSVSRLCSGNGSLSQSNRSSCTCTADAPAKRPQKFDNRRVDQYPSVKVL